MKKVKAILAFLPIALLLAIVGATNATPVGTPGVSVGNTFTYGNVSLDWHSNDPSVTIARQWESLNGTAWFTETVENVVGTNVTINSMLHYNNGTEIAQAGWINVDTGDFSNMTNLFLISANLNEGDQVYTGSTYSNYTVNETIPMTYPGGSRQTNHFNTTMEVSTPPYYYINYSMNMYWDRATGVLTKLYGTSNQITNYTTTYTTYWSFSVELTGSNQWVVPEFVGLPPTLLLLASLALVTLAYRRKMHKTQNHH